MKISVVYGSAVPLENIEMLTRHVIEGKPDVTEIYLRDYHMKIEIRYSSREKKMNISRLLTR
ncbi:hypothetical protein [Sinobaca sp. H24]|uniref:hypothetical protein n=1 Tax=Sinobaca sp. H24 TaxID=2923376 RepID=UPI002079AF75|nr:hypothetical protein [Sinobaca sp. H24]